jgi:hypothetical protein
MRKTVFLSTVILLLILGLALSVSACGGGTTESSTTVSTAGGSSTTATGESTTTVTGNQTTTSASGGETTTSSSEGETTTTSEEVTTTTEATPTSDTTDHSAELRQQYPSTESFDNSNWATLSAAPASHLGAAVDIKGLAADTKVDPDSRYLTWELTVTGAGSQPMRALCRTNVTIDRSVLSGASAVEVKGLVVGVQDASAGGGPIIYVSSVQKAS